MEIEKINAKYIIIRAYTMFFDDSFINGNKDSNYVPNMPCIAEEDNCWQPIIDIDEGKILDWPNDIEANIIYQVNGDCEIICKTKDDKTICTNENYKYVPKFLSPGEKECDYYIQMNVSKNGHIENWNVEDVKKWMYTQAKFI